MELKPKLKKSVLVREKGPKHALVLDAEVGGIFECSGDLAKFLLILFENGNESLESLRKKLAAASPSFKKNKQQQECLHKTLSHLQKLGLLEVPSNQSSSSSKKSTAKKQAHTAQTGP